MRYIGLICQHIIELRLLGFKLVWLAARKWNQYNSHFTGKLDQLHKALYQDIETRFSHYCIVVPLGVLAPVFAHAHHLSP